MIRTTALRMPHKLALVMMFRLLIKFQKTIQKLVVIPILKYLELGFTWSGDEL